MRIFITGGAGFIGSYLTEKLLLAGHDVAIFDNRLNFINNPDYYNRMLKLRKKLFTKKPTYDFRGDIRNAKSLQTALKKCKPGVIVHLAGLPMARVPLNHAEAMKPINLLGTINVLEAFESLDSARRLIFTSSSMTYGHFKQNPQTEDVVLSPINDYGATKAAGEYFVRLLRKEWVIIRPTSVYGFADCANRVTQLLIDAAVAGKPAWVVKGESLDFSYIEDVADGFVQAILTQEADHKTFNISRGESRLASDFAEVLKKHFPDFSYEVREPSSQQVFRGALDITRAKRILKFKPRYGMEDGIKKTLELMKEFGLIKPEAKAPSTTRRRKSTRKKS